MPSVVDYSRALTELRREHIISVYHNSGALGFERGIANYSVGWIGPDDPTIRPEARNLARSIAAPYDANLSQMLIRAWRDVVGSDAPAWLMPASHWAYELEFGSGAWMPALLHSLDVDPDLLRPLNNAAAIEFVQSEADSLERAARMLLEHLHGSDFTIAFPARPIFCRLHHHKQLWWTSSDAPMSARLSAMVMSAR